MPVPRKNTGKTPRSGNLRAAGQIDAQLARYREMRDFSVTAEPAGKSHAPESIRAESPPVLPFVVQKHAASHLHYDFRLGWKGVLKSWAVAKGPSYVPADKRLAVQVEDHPIEYGGFEGIIPKGQYGGGTVMLWDQGTWSPQPGHEDIDAGLRSGSLKFTLQGKKLRGNWTLIRMGGKAAGESKPNWLLIKEHDPFEAGPGDPPVTESQPRSVVTGRSLEQIASSKDHIWNSKDTATGDAWYRSDAGAKAPGRKPAVRKKSSPPASDLAHQTSTPPAIEQLPIEALPAFIPPQLALSTVSAPSSSGWIHELKLDGYRIQARKDGSRVQLLTRTGLDWTRRMPAIARQIATLPASSALLDGEVVVLDAKGNTSFADLQAAFQDGLTRPLTYFVFDILHLEGHDLRGLPLLARKSILGETIAGAGNSIRLGEHIEADATDVFEQACRLGSEGIVSKRSASTYRSGRSVDWLKRKCIHEQEFVIGGFTPGGKDGIGIGSLLLGYYTGDHLVYAGRTGTGFTRKTHRTLLGQLQALRQAASPFHKPPAEARRSAIWVMPQLVAQVRFATWTADHLLRQASFKGLREDKPALEVHRDDPVPDGSSSSQARHQSALPRAAKVASSPSSARAERSGSGKSSAALPAPPVRLTHPDKVLDPASGLTKQQLADYFLAIAPWILPHIAERPLSIVRCPGGTSKPCFYQKHSTAAMPGAIQAISVPSLKTGKSEPYITLATPGALVELAQLGVLEIHPWGSRNSDLEHPDRIVIDLDPDPAISWRTLADSALDIRKQLKSLGLQSFLKTTGGKGLHIVVPIQPTRDWAAVKSFAHTFALAMEQKEPALYLTKMSKAARKGRIFLDYLRNERGSTAIAAYSPRARASAPVSLPLPWNALKASSLPVYPVADFKSWQPLLRRNPWRSFAEIHQTLP